jgi:hypothetical protein
MEYQLKEGLGSRDSPLGSRSKLIQCFFITLKVLVRDLCPLPQKLRHYSEDLEDKKKLCMGKQEVGEYLKDNVVQ